MGVKDHALADLVKERIALKCKQKPNLLKIVAKYMPVVKIKAVSVQRGQLGESEV